MPELTFSAYETHARTTAYFLDNPDIQARFDVVEYGFNEEIDELLYHAEYPHELSGMLWGNVEVDPVIKQRLSTDVTAEIGDVLFYVSAAAMLHEVTLPEIAVKGYQIYTGDEASDDDLVMADFDAALKPQIDPDLPADYDPNYFGMQFWNLDPFPSCRGFDIYNVENTKGPLLLDADGRYALERTTRWFSDRIHSTKYFDRDSFIAFGGIAIGALSIVLQNRFDTSLETAALHNIEKRERRKQAGVILDGVDPERTRQAGDPRPKITGFENTIANLICAPEAETSKRL